MTGGSRPGDVPVAGAAPSTGLGLRVLMFLTGVVLLAVHLLVAVAALHVVGTLWQLRPSLPIAVAVVLVTALVTGYASYRLGAAGVLRALDAREVPRSRAPRLYDRLDALSAEMDVETPTVYVADMGAPNALSLGGKTNAIAVDPRLTRVLDDTELEAILAHELAHIESYDGLVRVLGYSIVRTVGGLVMLVVLPLSLFYAGVERALAWLSGYQPAPLSHHLVLAHVRAATVATLLAAMLTLVLRAYARRREFAADERAAEVTGNPRAMASALATIERLTDPGWGFLSDLYVSGDEEGTLSRLFATHPPTDERIENLRKQAERMRRARSTGKRIEIE